MTNWNCCNHDAALYIRVDDGCGCNAGNMVMVTEVDSCGCGCNSGVAITSTGGNGCGCGCNGTSWTTTGGTAWTSKRCGCNCGC